MISTIPAREKISIESISNHIGVYLLAVKRIDELGLLRANCIMDSNLCQGVKARQLKENKEKTKQAKRDLL